MQKSPLAERRAARLNAIAAQQRTMSFDPCVQAYIAAHRDGWRNAKHAGQWESTLRLHAHPVIGKLPVVWLIIGGNALWVLGSALVVLWFAPTPLGMAFLLAQAAVVAVLLVLEKRALDAAQA